MTLLVALAGCADTVALDVGDFTVELHGSTGTLTARHRTGGELRDLAVVAGAGDAEIEMQFGSFRFTDERLRTVEGVGYSRVRRRLGPPWLVEVLDQGGESLGLLSIGGTGEALLLTWTPHPDALRGDRTNRAGFSAACEAGDHFLGLGSHAFDVDHMGEAFALWTSEPGIGKVESDVLPDDWLVTGTRHSTSFPAPIALRPQIGQALVLDTSARVEVDLCASRADRFELLAWDDSATLLVFGAGSALGAVEQVARWRGLPPLPPPWVFAPWNDAIRGRPEVERVAQVLREAGASVSALWTEDWKGGEENATGYHLTGEWTVDETLYPEARGLADDLHAQGFKWLGYFSPFVFEGTDAWDDALEADVLLRDEAGELVTFLGATFDTTSMADLSTGPGRAWFQGYMEGALELGFDGWMADFAEWLPASTALRSGHSGLDLHNAYPELWQSTNAQVLADRDATFFVRSGWISTGAVAPVVWAGDQRTSFDPDDGFPTVVPLGLGLSAMGVPVFTHDVAGYQSVGNPPSTRELWFRWASLGAWSPVFRTHHGAYDDDNWKFDTDEETLAHYVALTREHMRLFPYRYALAAGASRDGTPMILPVAFVTGERHWGRTDAWMLGEALLVAPVVTGGALGRQVDLPLGEVWYDWNTLDPVSSGYMEAALTEIPVFARGGTTVPTLARIPDTVAGGGPGLTTLEDVDGERIVYLFGGGGDFEEADGTRYLPRGNPTGIGEATATLTVGRVEVAGVSVEVRGPVERRYTFVVR